MTQPPIKSWRVFAALLVAGSWALFVCCLLAAVHFVYVSAAMFNAGSTLLDNLSAAGISAVINYVIFWPSMFVMTLVPGLPGALMIMRLGRAHDLRVWLAFMAAVWSLGFLLMIGDGKPLFALTLLGGLVSGYLAHRDIATERVRAIVPAPEPASVPEPMPAPRPQPAPALDPPTPE